MWVALVAMVMLGLGSWVFRAGFIISAPGRALATQLDPWLRYARPAVLAALLASVSVRQASAPTFELLPYAAALLVAAAVAGRTRNLAFAFAAGSGIAFLLW